MQISNLYVAVKKIEESETTEGFKAVEVQDSFVYKGQLVHLPAEVPVYIGNRQLLKGDKVMFHKYSPDTVEIEEEGEKLKFVKIVDLLAVL